MQPRPTPARAVLTKAPVTRQDLYKEESSSLPEPKSTPQGFKLPGEHSAPSEGVREEPTREPTRKVYAHIQLSLFCVVVCLFVCLSENKNINNTYT